MIRSNSRDVKDILHGYHSFLSAAARRYRWATKKHNIGCKQGCYECCATGFFDITLLDALYLHEALQHVPVHVRKQIEAKAHEQLDLLERKKVFFRKSPLLRSISSIKALARKSATMSCPALGGDGKCMIYGHRPHICRIFGPAIRGYRSKLWLKGCRHFTKHVLEEDVGLADQYVQEIELKKELFLKAGRKKIRDIDTIIPAAVALDLRKWL